jgi:hypothetical protein
MKKYTFEQIVQLAENAVKRIKNSPENPYNNLAFVDGIFESFSPSTRKDIKNLVKGNFKGSLHENVFIKETLSPAQHLYNYLYENNMLSKYDELAEYMDYPSVSELQNEMVDESEILNLVNQEGHSGEYGLRFIGLKPEQYDLRKKQIFMSKEEFDRLVGNNPFKKSQANELMKLDFRFVDSAEENIPKPEPVQPPTRKPKPYEKPGYERMFKGEPDPKRAFNTLVKEEDSEYDESLWIEDATNRLINKLKSLPVGVASVEDEKSDICLELDGECEEMKNFSFYTTCKYNLMQGDTKIGEVDVEMGDDDYFKANVKATGYEGEEEDYNVDEITEVTNMINDFLEKQKAVGLELENITIPNAKGFENTDVTVEKDVIRADTMYFKFENLPVDFLYEILNMLIQKFD